MASRWKIGTILKDGMNKRFYIIALGALAVLLSCSKEREDASFVKDDKVHFGVSTFQGTFTKTAYSGEVVGGYERIDWKTDGTDRIRIISNVGVTKSGDKKADYIVVPNAKTNQAGLQKSEAEADPAVAGKDLYWQYSSSDHYFFGMYPVPASDADFALGAEGKTAVIKGTVPSVQVPLARVSTPSGGNTIYEYPPDMSNAYMYASAQVGGSSVGAKKVELLFKPLFTAFKFVIKAGDTASMDYKLKKLTLTSADGIGSDLYGNFTAEVGLQDALTGEILSVGKSSEGRSVSMDLNMSEKLAGNTVIATLLALPVDQTYLTVDLTFEDNAGKTRHRKLNLQNKQVSGSPWVTLKAPRKLVVNMNLTDIEYIFDVTQELAQFHPNGSTEDDYYHVTSYRKRYNAAIGKDEYEAWPWDAAEYNTGDGWTTSKPNWLTLEAYTGDGKAPTGDPIDFSTAPVSYDATVEQSYDLAADDVWLNLGNTTPGTAIDLSNYDFMAQAAYPGCSMQAWPSAAPYETANCYVVSGPGWYKIPMVFGNGYQQGNVNERAYRANYADFLLDNFRGTDGNSYSWGVGEYYIDNPWITYNLTQARYPHLLWQDVENMVYVPQFDAGGPDNDKGQKILLQGAEERNSWCEDHYLYFKVDNLANRAGGNAVIAITDENGTVLWSWHIWAVPEKVLKTQMVYYWLDPKYQAVGSVPANDTAPSKLANNEMLDMNLGYVAGKPDRFCRVKFRQKTSGYEAIVDLVQKGDASTASAVHYQWGRKDPMFSVGGDKDSGYAKTIYYEDGSSVNSLQLPLYNEACYWSWNPSSPVPYWDRPDSQLGRATQNPYTFFTIPSSGPYTWSGARYDNMWDANVTHHTKVSTEHFDGYYVQKTVYDPCPPGFKVPNEYAFTGFNLKGMDANVITDAEKADPTLVINGLRPSFYINGDHGDGQPFGSQGMYLYCDPRDPDNGIMFFPALGRRVGFGPERGKISGMYAEALYWTAAPFYDEALYARTFTMRRSLDDGSDTEGYPQCIPVYTVAAAPSNIKYSGFLRAHGCQVRPVRDRYEDAYNIPYVVVSVDITVPGGRSVNTSITL